MTFLEQCYLPHQGKLTTRRVTLPSQLPLKNVERCDDLEFKGSSRHSLSSLTYCLCYVFFFLQAYLKLRLIYQGSCSISSVGI